MPFRRELAVDLPIQVTVVETPVHVVIGSSLDDGIHVVHFARDLDGLQLVVAAPGVVADLEHEGHVLDEDCVDVHF